MRILLTNDDGVHAPGLKSLETVARALCDDVWIVAPETDQSGTAHSLTLNDPLRIRKVSERHFAVKGTPTDSVIMALRQLMADTPPDLILSGVNRGHNVADDVTYSGTIAAAIEGTLLGIKSIALSQAYGYDSSRETIRWATAEAKAPALLKEIIATDLPAETLININFPDCDAAEVEGVAITRQGKRNQDTLAVHERVDGRGAPYFWLGFKKAPIELVEGTDLWALANRRISVTPLQLNLTHYDVLSPLQDRLAGV